MEYKIGNTYRCPTRKARYVLEKVKDDVVYFTTGKKIHMTAFEFYVDVTENGPRKRKTDQQSLF